MVARERAAWPQVAHRVPGRVRFRFEPGRLSARRRAGLGRALEMHRGVLRYRFNPAADSLVVEFDGRVRLPALRRLLAGAPEADPDADRHFHRRRSHLASLTSVAAGGLLAMAGQPLAVPVLAVGAAPIFSRATRRLVRDRKVGVDALDAAALTLTVATGQVLTGAIMTGLIEGGEWLRDLTASRSRRALGALMVHEEATCWRQVDGRRLRTPVREVGAGDVLILSPGDRVPVDGTVRVGAATLDERLLTGEPLPVLRSPGQPVYAMTVVTAGELQIEAAGPAAQSRAGRIMAFLEQAPLADTRMADHARRFADRFVLPVLGLATGAYLITGSASRAASILIFDLATGIRVAAPTTMLAALIAAAREGILIKGASAIERLAAVDAIVLDKTGTLTVGEPVVAGVTCFNGLAREELLGVAAAADHGINHPLAVALASEARKTNLELPRRTACEYHVGLGVDATMAGGRRFLVGNRQFMDRMGVRIPSNGSQRAAGVSEVFVATPRECLGAVYFRDQPRQEAADVVQRLRGLGVDRVVILTGDTHTAAEQLAQTLGITEWQARVSPEAKADFVRGLQAQGRKVAVVGDGVNDSLAFGLADVPIAMGAGADVARATASVVLLESRLTLLPIAIERARSALGVLNQNFAIIAAPNAAGLAGALVTSMNPAVAALLSNGSAVAAAANGLRPLVGGAPGR